MMMIPAGDEVSTVVIMTTVGGSGGGYVTLMVTVEFEKGTIMNVKTEVKRGGMSFDMRAGAIGAETRRLLR